MKLPINFKLLKDIGWNCKIIDENRVMDMEYVLIWYFLSKYMDECWNLEHHNKTKYCHFGTWWEMKKKLLKCQWGCLVSDVW